MKKHKRIHPDDIALLKKEVVQEIENIIRDSIYKKWIKSKEVCELLGISQAKLHDLRANKHIPYSYIDKQFYYKLEDIQNVLEKNKIGDFGSG